MQGVYNRVNQTARSAAYLRKFLGAVGYRGIGSGNGQGQGFLSFSEQGATRMNLKKIAEIEDVNCLKLSQLP
jgi:hypothetical protein